MFTLSFHDLLTETAPGLGARLGYWPQRILTVTVIQLLAAVNIRGVRGSGGVQLAITLAKVGTLLYIIALPFLALLWASGDGGQAADPANLRPAWPGGEEITPGLLRTVQFARGETDEGLDVAAPVVVESELAVIRHPARGQFRAVGFLVCSAWRPW